MILPKNRSEMTLFNNICRKSFKHTQKSFFMLEILEIKLDLSTELMEDDIKYVLWKGESAKYL